LGGRFSATVAVAFSGRAGREQRHGEHIVEKFRGHYRSFIDFGKGGSTTWLKTKN
jgi:hypothetical protein